MNRHYERIGLNNPIVFGTWEGKPAFSCRSERWALIGGSWKRINDGDMHVIPPDEFKRLFPALPPLPPELLDHVAKHAAWLQQYAS